MQLATKTYKITAVFPKHALYGLSQRMRRAALSVPSKIAEGKGHWSDRGFASFVFHARGSLLELETQLEIARNLGYVSEDRLQGILGQTKMVGRSLTG